MINVTPDQFFEADESPDEIFRTFEAGDKQLTRPPARGQTEYLYLDPVPGQQVTTTIRAVIHGSRLHSAANV